MSIELGLERIRKLQEHLPPYTRPTCHIAGTNGKGSVCALLSSILAASSPPLRVGRYNSPHLVSVLDAISIDAAPISSTAYTEARREVERANATHAIGASSFELATATALRAFERARVDVVVLEVGMGGRLDATNVVPDSCILVSALTGVDLDHQAFLGNTVAEIAREKAAIVRKGRPIVVGTQRHGEVLNVVREVAEAVGGEIVAEAEAIVVAGTGTKDEDTVLGIPPRQSVKVHLPPFDEPFTVSLPLYGEHQVDNLKIALGVVSALLTQPACLQSPVGFRDRITPATISAGIASTRWPGRLSYHTIALPETGDPSRQLVVLADGAHNPASAASLGAYLSSLLADENARPVRLTYVIALSHSPPKTPAQTLAPLFSLSSRRRVRLGAALVRFSPPEGMPWVRSVPPSDIRAAVEPLCPEGGVDVWLEEEDGPVSGDGGEVAQALRWAAGRRDGAEDELVVLAGSLYLVADFYRLLGTLGQGDAIWRGA